MIDLCVIGAGPAGLMAAETAVNRGLSVVIVDAKLSFGRKFLMAGKSGLNLTKNEPFETFLSSYNDAAEWLSPIIKEFDNQAAMDWARNLGQSIFTGSSNRVFPTDMKASPLLRAWLTRLANKGVKFNQGWRWLGWENEDPIFKTSEGKRLIKSHTTVLALGGASWSRLGSDGEWANIFADHGILINPFKPSNMGFSVNWSKHMLPYFGSPLKSIRLTSGSFSTLGECVISSKGLEGSGVYAASKSMREGNPLILDLLPDLDLTTLIRRFEKLPKKASRSTIVRKVLRLDKAKTAIFNEFSQCAQLKNIIIAAKSLFISHLGPHPIEEAISTAGGVPQLALNDHLMLKSKPGIFCDGEMLDWEAPTGGYLITGCLATGKWAGSGASDFILH
jgi:hypothetical protein